MPRKRIYPTLAFLYTLLLLAPHTLAAEEKEQKQKWVRVSSDHFSVLTDAGRDRGRAVAIRLEQMRAVFGQLLMRSKLKMPQPLDVIAFRTDKEYAAVAPIRKKQPIVDAGFFLHGPDRNYIVLNLFEPESWRAVVHDFAHLLLYYNYPPTQNWFDEGFAEYMTSMQIVNDRQFEIGGDPLLNIEWYEDMSTEVTFQKINPPRSFTELLSTPVWLSTPDLFTMRQYKVGYEEGTHHTLFHAQSWMVMHYLLNKNKLAETGAYFDLVENQGVPTPQAIQRAFGVTPEQFTQGIKDYFNTLLPLFVALDASKAEVTLENGMPNGQPYHFPLPLDADDIGTSARDIPEAEAQAQVAEMMLRLPERRQQATTQLQALIHGVKTETATAHRAMAWVDEETNQFSSAQEELDAALQIDPKDPWVRYYLAEIAFRASGYGTKDIKGLPNMMQDLQIVLDWDVDFAEAYNMLGMARLQGGGTNSALAAMRLAVQLSPRNEDYVLNLAEIYIAGKKWDQATDLLNRLKGSDNPRIAHAAQNELDDMPTLRKYGIRPQREASAEPPKEQPADDSDKPDADESTSEHPAEAASAPGPDNRPVHFLKARLVAVDCSKPPAAILTVSAAGKPMKFRTDDYKQLALIGAEQFSCQWKDVPVSINYRAGGKTQGDLVSLEVQ